MQINRIRLRSFRNYHEKDVETDTLTILVGPNASGKTNLVEAIQLATSGSSFRNPPWEEVIRWGEDSATVEIEASGASTERNIRLHVPKVGRRSFCIDGKNVARTAQVAGLVPTVVFTPDDLAIVKASAEARRGAIDVIGEQAWAVYAEERKAFGRILRQRNRALREGLSDDELAPWDAQLAVAGARFVHLRTRLLSRIAPLVEEKHSALSAGEELRIDYSDSIGLELGEWVGGADKTSSEERIRSRLVARRAEERARGTTLAGPQRDDIIFTIGEVDARSFGSQGQQRTIALAWKLAALDALRTILGRAPVLLLDDVMSELDESRRHALMRESEARAQTFITTTNISYFSPKTLSRARVIEL